MVETEIELCFINGGGPVYPTFHLHDLTEQFQYTQVL